MNKKCIYVFPVLVFGVFVLFNSFKNRNSDESRLAKTDVSWKVCPGTGGNCVEILWGLIVIKKDPDGDFMNGGGYALPL